MDTELSFEELVEWATTPAESGLRLYYWGALVYYNLELLNKTWEQLGATPSPPESIETIQKKFTLPQNNYSYHISVLERPILKFNTSSDSPYDATLRRRIQKLLDFRFSTPHSRRPLLTSINASLSGAQHLNIETERPELSYSTQKNVELQWDIADYTLTGNHDDVNKLLYKEHYEDNPSKRNAILGSFAPAQDGLIKPPINFLTYADSRAGQVVAYVALGEDGHIPPNPPLMLVNGKAATALVDRRKSLTGIPADLGQLPQLLAPHQQFSMTAANTDAPKDHVAIYDFVGFSGTINAAMPPKFDVNPLSSLLSPLQEIELKVFPEPASVNWELQPGAKGSLVRVGDEKLVYRAPEKFEPSDLSWIDVASATIEGLRYESAFITFFEQQTGYFKFSKVDNRVHIQLWVTRRNGDEEIIPSEQIEWKILHGNGSINQGTFTPPAHGASPFTVIQAFHKDSDPFPTFACVMLPVPMLSVDEAVTMFNS